MTDATTIYERGWIFRLLNKKQASSEHVILMIHGWTGDETSMEVFASQLPDRFLVILPRGPVAAEPSGYGWANLGQAYTAGSMDAFLPSAHALMDRVVSLMDTFQRESVRLRIAGFSQGAALCHALAFHYPESIERVAILAGYVPQFDVDPDWEKVSKISFYVAHGTLDDTISVVQARASVARLQAAGVQVQYCEKPVGHKLAGACLNELRDFMAG